MILAPFTVVRLHHLLSLSLLFLTPSQETKFVMNGCESEVRVFLFVFACGLTVSECMWERGRCMYACVCHGAGVGGEREGGLLVRYSYGNVPVPWRIWYIV